MPRARKPSAENGDLTRRYATERSRQLAVLLLIAAAILAVSILLAGPRNVFPPGWWHIDLP